ncbi:hypothetical protein [Dietzia cinnamea]|uniref:hypothetical protein n=1 Tax=Dietzia cinnamea TaxID=321318 RepID=UPI0021A2FF87|nr:hypothetical protein [Dietzia cinnamea]MCT2121562.1 hypothetical protein [Dietzia cinnamea]
MTGMEHTIERAAQVAASAMDGYSEGASHIDDYRIIARALAEAGLLAPSPLTEEWGTRFGSSEYVHFGTGVEYPFFFNGDPPKGVNVRRYVSDWMPVGHAEGDGRADRPSWVDEHGINHADGDGGRW